MKWFAVVMTGDILGTRPELHPRASSACEIESLAGTSFDRLSHFSCMITTSHLRSSNDKMKPAIASRRLFNRLLALPPPTRCRAFSVLNRPPPNYPGHVPLTLLERGALAIGSAFGSLRNPYRHDLIASLGEATAKPYFVSRLRRAMLENPTGRRILRDKPRITSKSMSLEKLRQLPENTVGRAYAAWLDKEGVTPDTRDAVKYIDDPCLLYTSPSPRDGLLPRMPSSA